MLASSFDMTNRKTDPKLACAVWLYMIGILLFPISLLFMGMDFLTGFIMLTVCSISLITSMILMYKVKDRRTDIISFLFGMGFVQVLMGATLLLFIVISTLNSSPISPFWGYLDGIILLIWGFLYIVLLWRENKRRKALLSLEKEFIF